MFYCDGATGELIFAMIRGDFEVNESKLANTALVAELKFADDAAILAAGAVPGYASPIGLAGKKVKVVLDRSALESSNLVVGANASEKIEEKLEHGVYEEECKEFNQKVIE